MGNTTRGILRTVNITWAVAGHTAPHGILKLQSMRTSKSSVNPVWDLFRPPRAGVAFRLMARPPIWWDIQIKAGPIQDSDLMSGYGFQVNLGIGLTTPALPLADEIVKREEDIKVEERREEDEEERRGPRTIQGRGTR